MRSGRDTRAGSDTVGGLDTCESRRLGLAGFATTTFMLSIINADLVSHLARPAF